MESMTGYAFMEDSTEQFSYSIEIKTLNSKYLEIHTDLSKILQKDENEIKQLVKKKITRGKVVLSIDVFDWVKAKDVLIDRALLEKYHKELKSIENDLKTEGYFSGDILFTLDNIVRREKAKLTEKSRKQILNSVKNAVDKTINMRKKEGEATKKDIQKFITSITDSLNKVKALSKDVSKILYKRLKDNIESITGPNSSDVRLLTEIAILADKIDINEEIVRLKDHIKKGKSIINEKGQIGKKLDFLAQEMFREVNTITSKANNSEISHLTVEMKNYIDKIREQSRNIV